MVISREKKAKMISSNIWKKQAGKVGSGKKTHVD
jgi:hypothetical protein